VTSEATALDPIGFASMANGRFDPLQAVGLVLGLVNDATEPVFLGSCFALRAATAVLTAGHCVGDLPPERLLVRMPRGVARPHPPPPFPVSEVIRHPAADVALLRLAVEQWTCGPFTAVEAPEYLGQDVYAHGFPEDVRTVPGQPTSRIFKGYVQRVFEYSSPFGYEYKAVELDFACPGGLSGGPVFPANRVGVVLGVATENFESTTSLDAIEETTRDGSTVVTRYQRVLSYGVAVELDAIRDWLDEHHPPIPPLSAP
jgi:hypothetical protein